MSEDVLYRMLYIEEINFKLGNMSMLFNEIIW